MPFIPTSQEWLTQSALLLDARPTTARVTTKYNIKPAKIRKARRDAGGGGGGGGDDNNNSNSNDKPTSATDPTARPPRATLILKTFDPDSGVCLKYKTTKAAEVSRLVQLLGSLGRKMAALPDAPAPAPAPAPAVEEEAVAAVAPGSGSGAGVATLPVAAGTTGQAAQQGQGAAGGGGGGGKGKKKKGKR